MPPSRSARFAQLVVGHPGRVLAAALLCTLALAPLVARLRLDTDVVDLFPRHSPAAQAFARFTHAFVAEQNLLVLVQGAPDALPGFAAAYARKLGASPRIAEVRYRLTARAGRYLRDHLLQLLDDRELDTLAARTTPAALRAQAHRLRALISAPGGSALAPLLTADPLELLPLVARRLSHGLPVDAQSGYFRSNDGRALLVYVRPRASSYDLAADRMLLQDASLAARELGAKVSPDGAGQGLRVSFTGACAYALAWRDWLHRDMTLSTVISTSAVLLLFALFFRALRVLPLVALPLGIGLVWTAAAASLLYGRVNAVSLAFGTILVAIGIDLPIQLYNRLRERLGAQPPNEALQTTLQELAAPSLIATMGPAAVFFACGLSDYRGLRELGLLAGLGLAFNCLAMLTVFPALLARLPPRLWARPQAPSRRGLLLWVGRLAERRPRAMLTLAALVGLCALPLALRVRFDQRLMAIQPASMAPARVQAELERRFGQRSHTLIVLLEDRDRERALERDDVWIKEAERLRRAQLIRGYDALGTLFPSQATQRERKSRLQAIDPARAARELRSALAEVGFTTAPFEPFLQELAGPAGPLLLEDAAAHDLGFLVHSHLHDGAAQREIALYLYPAQGAAGARALAALKIFAKGPAGGTVTGAPVLETVLRQVVERDTRVVTLASMLAVALLLGFYYRRLRPWLAVMLPLGLAWVLFAAALALLRVPLNLFDLLAVPLVIGYGIDDHIFLVHRHQQAPAAGVAPALASTGRAIVLTSLSTMAGFAGLAAARLSGLRMLGLSGALAVAFCLFAAFAVLPALLTLLYPVSGRAR